MKTEKIELAELSLESVDVQNKHQALLLKRKLIEAELSALKSRVRGANTHKTRLSNENYRQITNRQAVLAKKMAEIDVAVAPLKARLREIGALSTLHYATRTDATATDSNKAVIPS